MRLACVRHAASVHSEPGSNSPVIPKNCFGPTRYSLFSFQRTDSPCSRECQSITLPMLRQGLLSEPLQETAFLNLPLPSVKNFFSVPDRRLFFPKRRCLSTHSLFLCQAPFLLFSRSPTAPLLQGPARAAKSSFYTYSRYLSNPFLLSSLFHSVHARHSPHMLHVPSPGGRSSIQSPCLSRAAACRTTRPASPVPSWRNWRPPSPQHTLHRQPWPSAMAGHKCPLQRKPPQIGRAHV